MALGKLIHFLLKALGFVFGSWRPLAVLTVSAAGRVGLGNLPQGRVLFYGDGVRFRPLAAPGRFYGFPLGPYESGTGTQETRLDPRKPHKPEMVT